MKYVTKHESHAYDVKAQGEWARVYISEGLTSGSIAIISSFGNFANFWGNIGVNPLREWLQTTGFHYFMNKTADNRGECFDIDKMIEDLVRMILTRRHERSLDRETAREYYDDVTTSLSEVSTKAHFWAAAPEWLPEFVDYDPPSGNVECPQCRGFWDILWPHILEAWKFEITGVHDA